MLSFLLVVLISIIIFGLRIMYSGVKLGRRVAVRAFKMSGIGKRLGSKRMRQLERVLHIATAPIKVVITALHLLQGLICSIGVVMALSKVLMLLLVVAAVSNILLINGDYDFSGIGVSDSVSSSDSSSSSYSGDIDFSVVTDEGSREYLEEMSKKWGPEVTEDRIKVILKAASLIGKSTYSQDVTKRGGSSDDQTVFDCSSFIFWSFNKALDAGLPYSGTTATFYSLSQFKRLSSASDLIPGDPVLWKDTTATGSKNHAGIYIGTEDDGTMIYIHCTSANGQATKNKSWHRGSDIQDGARISYYPFSVYWTYTGYGSS